MYSSKAYTFEDNLSVYNEHIMHQIYLSEIDSVTSTVRNRCIFRHFKDDESIKQYYNDKLVSISTQNSYTLTKNKYPHIIESMYTPGGIFYQAKFINQQVIKFICLDPVTKTELLEKTYLAENLRLADMTWDTLGNLLTPLTSRWVHSIINLKYVNSWIKNNIQELVDMRNNWKKLNTDVSNSNVVAYITDIQAYLNNNNINIADSVLNRLLDASNFKNVVAEYLRYIGDENAFIDTYFDTYEEFEQYKSSRLRKNK